ncbi:unnamed protein product [Gadus morhua 'NCC']
MKDDECLAEFRVRKADIPLLVEALGIPTEFVCEQRSVVDGTEALCMLLKRRRSGEWRVSGGNTNPTSGRLPPFTWTNTM